MSSPVNKKAGKAPKAGAKGGKAEKPNPFLALPQDVQDRLRTLRWRLAARMYMQCPWYVASTEYKMYRSLYSAMRSPTKQMSRAVSDMYPSDVMISRQPEEDPTGSIRITIYESGGARFTKDNVGAAELADDAKYPALMDASRVPRSYRALAAAPPMLRVRGELPQEAYNHIVSNQLKLAVRRSLSPVTLERLLIRRGMSPLQLRALRSTLRSRIRVSILHAAHRVPPWAHTAMGLQRPVARVGSLPQTIAATACSGDTGASEVGDVVQECINGVHVDVAESAGCVFQDVGRVCDARALPLSGRVAGQVLNRTMAWSRSTWALSDSSLESPKDLQAAVDRRMGQRNVVRTAYLPTMARNPQGVNGAMMIRRAAGWVSTHENADRKSLCLPDVAPQCFERVCASVVADGGEGLRKTQEGSRAESYAGVLRHCLFESCEQPLESRKKPDEGNGTTIEGLVERYKTQIAFFSDVADRRGTLTAERKTAMQKGWFS